MVSSGAGITIKPGGRRIKIEVRELKKLPKKPKIKPSNLDKPNPKGGGKQKARKTGKRKKKENLTIHEKEEIKLNDPPKGWKLIGYKTWNPGYYSKGK